MPGLQRRFNQRVQDFSTLQKMKESNKKLLNELRPIRDQLAKSLERIDAVQAQVEALKSEQAKLKQSADKAREREGNESATYSRKVSEQKALGPEIERVRVIETKALREAVTFSWLIFESHIAPLLQHHFTAFRAQVGKPIRHLYDSDFEIDRIVMNSKPAQAFLRCISEARRNLESRTVDESILRYDLRLLNELLSKKPNLAEFWKIKEIAPY